MNKKISWLLITALPFSYSFSSETATWDTANNTVTYTVSSTYGMNSPTSVSLSQFNSADAATQEGSGDYVLTRVVLSLNGSISAVLTYENTTASSQNVSVQNMGGGSYFTYTPLGLTSATETYNISHNFGSVASGATVTAGDPVPLMAYGSGTVSSGDITSDLASFIGDGTISTVVNFDLMAWVWGAEGLKNETLVRSADMSVTYYYDVVPEPSTAALTAFGAAMLMLRRRRATPSA